MRVGVIGAGVVGSTLIKYLKRQGHEVIVDDPPKGINGHMRGCAAVFICVPVPTGDRGQEIGFLKQAIDKHKSRDMPFFVRSTVIPKTCDHLSKAYKLNVWACPEFLTERDADQTMSEQPILVGGPNMFSNNIAYVAHEELLGNIFPDKELLLMSNREAELAKFAHNCMGALKVTFFNGVSRYAESIGANYDRVLDGVLASGYINATHTQVPGPDGKFGYGGKCFPDNINSYLKEIRRLGLQHNLIDACQYENKIYRARTRGVEEREPPPSML